MSSSHSHSPASFSERGTIAVITLVFVGVFLVMWTGLIELIASMHRLSVEKTERELALQVAEAGIDYYRWHLEHDPDDYQDGTGSGSGPYIHTYTDNGGTTIGAYELTIAPPSLGSTIVTITSKGASSSNPSISRTIEARVGQRSLADYGFLTNSNAWFGDTESTSGKVHSNGGIRFDGTSDSIVSSAKDTYTCGPEHGCDYTTQNGIWGTGVPQNFWHFPPAYQIIGISFGAISIDLDTMQDDASVSLGQCSGQCSGYHIRFYNDATFSIYKVTQTWYTTGTATDGQTGDHNIDIRSESLMGNYNRKPMPADGLIFLGDKTWVDGVVNGKVTVGAARFPTGISDKSIIVSGNLTYLAKDGNHALGLIAQKDILIPRYSPNALEIDAAMMAQNGAAQRYYYGGNVLGTIQTYGSIITSGIWTWSWVNQYGQATSGYSTTVTSYDSNLTYAPPPSFPVIGSYTLISWREK